MLSAARLFPIFAFLLTLIMTNSGLPVAQAEPSSRPELSEALTIRLDEFSRFEYLPTIRAFGMEVDQFLGSNNPKFELTRLVQNRRIRTFVRKAFATMGSGSVLVEGAFDLHVGHMHKFIQRTGIMASVDVVEALFADKLDNQLIRVFHNRISILNICGACPDILSQLPLHYLIYEIVFLFDLLRVRP